MHILYSMEYNKPLALVNTTDTFQLISQNTTSIRLHFIKTPQRASVVMTHTQAATSTYSQHNDKLCCPLLLPLLPAVYITSALSKYRMEPLTVAFCCYVYSCDLEKTWLCAAVFTSVIWKRLGSVLLYLHQ